MSRSRLSKKFKTEGIEIIHPQNYTKFNDTIFESIDTEEKAYWLGFLYADGSISSTNNTIELSLKSSDINHLIKFKYFLVMFTLERETEHELGRDRERGRQNLKQAPGSKLSVQSRHGA